MFYNEVKTIELVEEDPSLVFGLIKEGHIQFVDMLLKKKIVDITKEEKKSSEKFGKDSHGKIIKLEDKGDNKERGKKYRIFAILLWIVAIIFEVIDSSDIKPTSSPCGI